MGHFILRLGWGEKKEQPFFEKGRFVSEKRAMCFSKMAYSFLRKEKDSYRTTFLATVVSSSYTVRSM